MNSAPYLSTSTRVIQAQEQARRAANERQVCLFPSYREAELRGYYSVKRLRQMGLEVRECEHRNYVYMVATRYGNLPVYSKGQASESRAPGPVPEPSEPQSFYPTGVQFLLPEEESTTNVHAALCGQNCPPTGSSRQTGPTETKRRRRGRAKPRRTGYFIDTPEDLDVPESHMDAENEIRLILHVVKSGIDRHGHQVEGVAHYNHPLGKSLMGSPLEQKAYKWLIDSDVLICADHRYSHRPDDPKSSFSKSYYVHSRWQTMAQVGDHQAQACRQAPSRPVAKDGLEVSQTTNGYGTDD